MLELLSPRKTERSPYHKRLAEAGVRGGWNYVLDHAWLFEKVDQYVKSHSENLLVLDVGCGDSMLHTFLETELKMGIIGIDRMVGLCQLRQRDHRLDLCIDFAKENQFFKGCADIVFWCSSIEHNTVEEQKGCVAESLKALKPGGLFLATFGYAKATHYSEPSEQTNLDARDAQRVFGVDWVGTTDFDEIVKEYQDNILNLDERHYRRYKTREYNFIVGAAEIVKPG